MDADAHPISDEQAIDALRVAYVHFTDAALADQALAERLDLIGHITTFGDATRALAEKFKEFRDHQVGELVKALP